MISDQIDHEKRILEQSRSCFTCSLGEEADAQQGLEIGLDQRLQGIFEINGVALQLKGLALGKAEKFDVAHVLSSTI